MINLVGRLIILAGLLMTLTAHALKSNLTGPQFLGGSIVLTVIIFLLFLND